MKSNSQSEAEISALAGEVKQALSPASSLTGVGSGSQPPCVLLPSQPDSIRYPETQRIGKYLFPAFGWSMVEICPPNILRLYLGGSIFVVEARGRWSPEPTPSPQKLPVALPDESHQAYLLRFLAKIRQPARNVDLTMWKSQKIWAGQSVEELLVALRSGRDLSNSCTMLPNKE